MRTFKLDDKAHIYGEEDSPNTVRECLEYIIKNWSGDAGIGVVQEYLDKLIKDGGGTTEYDNRLVVSWKDCVYNEYFSDFEMVRNIVDIIFE